MRAGLTLIIAGNQPSRAGATLKAMNLGVEGIGISDDWGVSKPDPAFFEQTLALTETARPGVSPDEILYVGDRTDNDVLPARAAGMRTALLRRGVHGYLHAAGPDAQQADVVVDDLHQLADWIADHNLR